MMNTFDDAGCRIDICYAAAQFVGFAVAFGYENLVGMGEVRRGFVQCVMWK